MVALGVLKRVHAAVMQALAAPPQAQPGGQLAFRPWDVRHALAAERRKVGWRWGRGWGRALGRQGQRGGGAQGRPAPLPPPRSPCPNNISEPATCAARPRSFLMLRRCWRG